ncbi:hypothetical protein T10_4152 [Trichinella papuae]|uniref:Uncharacterized protein n=1 Tax=Trichinella papuae TaxID=268474 RepID=A0A0V1MN15_9BILA|nr:hypothetical protein T10_4152 [Trichinella papuae]
MTKNPRVIQNGWNELKRKNIFGDNVVQKKSYKKVDAQFNGPSTNSINQIVHPFSCQATKVTKKLEYKAAVYTIQVVVKLENVAGSSHFAVASATRNFQNNNNNNNNNNIFLFGIIDNHFKQYLHSQCS